MMDGLADPTGGRVMMMVRAASGWDRPCGFHALDGSWHGGPGMRVKYSFLAKMSRLFRIGSSPGAWDGHGLRCG